MKTCPSCSQLGMPAWAGERSAEIARRCQLCGHVEEKPTALGFALSVVSETATALEANVQRYLGTANETGAAQEHPAGGKS